VEILNHPIIAFICYFLGGLFYLALFVTAYVRVTPYAEFKLIREGNISAAMILGGAVIGFCLPLCRAIEQSLSAWDLTFWATVALITQISAFLIFSRLLPQTHEKVEADQKAKAVLLAVLSIAIGLINAASMTE